MYEVCYEYLSVMYDYLKSKHDENAKLSCMDIDSFFVHVKTDDIYKDIAEDIKAIFDTSNYEIETVVDGKKNEKSDLKVN